MRVRGGDVAVEGRTGQTEVNQEALVEGSGSACSLGLRKGRPGSLNHLQSSGGWGLDLGAPAGGGPTTLWPARSS